MVYWYFKNWFSVMDVKRQAEKVRHILATERDFSYVTYSWKTSICFTWLIVATRYMSISRSRNFTWHFLGNICNLSHLTNISNIYSVKPSQNTHLNRQNLSTLMILTHSTWKSGILKPVSTWISKTMTPLHHLNKGNHVVPTKLNNEIHAAPICMNV